MRAEPTTGPLPESKGSLPWGIVAPNPELDPFCDWLEAHMAEVRDRMTRHGAVFIRGVNASKPEAFERIVRLIEPELHTEYFGTSPRDHVSGAVFHASELPGHYPIPSHIEMSFLPHPPKSLFFGCAVAPIRYGETPLVDFRVVWNALDPAVRERLASRGLRVVRNYAAPGAKPDPMQLKPWPDLFGTTDRDKVAEIAREHDLELTWQADGSLRIISFQPAVRKHPVTGEDVYFSHLQVFHASTAAEEYKRIAKLRPTARHLLTALYAQGLVYKRKWTTPRDAHPMHTTWSDGTEISASDLSHIRDVIWNHLAIVPWRKGDIMAIDNHAAAHGRLPFQGPREILVSWS